MMDELTPPHLRPPIYLICQSSTSTNYGFIIYTNYGFIVYTQVTQVRMTKLLVICTCTRHAASLLQPLRPDPQRTNQTNQRHVLEATASRVGTIRNANSVFSGRCDFRWDCWIAKPAPQAPMVVGIVVLELPSQAPARE